MERIRLVIILGVGWTRVLWVVGVAWGLHFESLCLLCLLSVAFVLLVGLDVCFGECFFCCFVFVYFVVLLFVSCLGFCDLLVDLFILCST